MDAQERHLEERRLELAEDMGVDPDDPAVWRALVVEEGTWTAADRKDTAGRNNAGGSDG